MKIVGVIFLLIGIAVGFVWPRVQLEFFGNEIAVLEFHAPGFKAPQPQTVSLKQSDNPVRVLFRATYLVDGKLPPVKIPTKIVITDRDGIFLTGGISFPTDGKTQGPELPTVRSGQVLNFNVLNDGDHDFAINLETNPNDGGIHKPDIEKISARIIANAPVTSDNLKALSAVFGLLGIYLLLRSRREKKGKSQPPQKWGRG